MKTYTAVITTDIKNKFIEPIEIRHIEAATSAELEQLKDNVWAIIDLMAKLNGWNTENEGTMFMACPADIDNYDCIFAKIYDDATGAEIDLD